MWNLHLWVSVLQNINSCHNVGLSLQKRLANVFFVGPNYCFRFQITFFCIYTSDIYCYRLQILTRGMTKKWTDLRQVCVQLHFSIWFVHTFHIQKFFTLHFSELKFVHPHISTGGKGHIPFPHRKFTDSRLKRAHNTVWLKFNRYRINRYDKLSV